jgi:hypothetical protein
VLWEDAAESASEDEDNVASMTVLPAGSAAGGDMGSAMATSIGSSAADTVLTPEELSSLTWECRRLPGSKAGGTAGGKGGKVPGGSAPGGKPNQRFPVRAQDCLKKATALCKDLSKLAGVCRQQEKELDLLKIQPFLSKKLHDHADEVTKLWVTLGALVNTGEAKDSTYDPHFEQAKKVRAQAEECSSRRRQR